MNLVSGGSGFIGSHLVDELLRSGEVCNLDIKRSRVRHKKLHTIIKDLRELKPNYFGAFDTLFHLAAMPWVKVLNPKRWFDESTEAFEVNTVGTHNLLNSIDSDLIVFTSTANLYGNGRKFKEDDGFAISSPYGYSKAVAERIIQLSGRLHVIFRFGTVVGPRGRCFPNLLVWNAINSDEPVEIFNGGDTIRDVIDVRDVVNALMNAENLDQGIYNISSGTEITGLDLAKTVQGVARERGHDLDYRLVDWTAPGYVPYSGLDISKVLDSGVWEPKHDLESTILSLFDFYEGGKIPSPPRWDEL